MATPPLEGRMFRGRGASDIRTPSLIRGYLSALGVFPEDTPGERAARPTQGDYMSRINQRIKLFIREITPRYQHPPKHSFLSLVNALLRLDLSRGSDAGKTPRNAAPPRWE